MPGQAAGAAVSAIGAYSGAKSRQLALRGQAFVADMNSRMAERGAQQELARGQAEVAQLTRRAGQVKGAQRASMAANGIDLGEGNAGEVLTSTDIMKEEDVNTLTANAVRAAWGHRVESTNYANSAVIDRASADSISPGMEAFTSLLGSATQLSKTWYSAKQAGVKAGGKKKGD
jgi:hypothetical protein